MLADSGALGFAVHAYWQILGWSTTVCCACMQIVEHYRKHLPVISKSEGTFKVAFIERHHKRRIENYDELLEWCNTKLQLPAGSHFKEVSCVPLNLDHADRYLQTLAEMQTVDVLVSPKTPPRCRIAFLLSSGVSEYRSPV